MAFPDEPITVANVAMGPVVVTSVESTFGRVTDWAMETAPGVYEHKGGGNIQQIWDIFETEYGSGKIKLTLDEVLDDAVTGFHTTFALRQKKPKASAKEIKATAATAYVKVLGYKGERNGKPTMTEIEVTPYKNDAAGKPWAFDSNATTS